MNDHFNKDLFVAKLKLIEQQINAGIIDGHINYYLGKDVCDICGKLISHAKIVYKEEWTYMDIHNIEEHGMSPNKELYNFVENEIL